MTPPRTCYLALGLVLITVAGLACADCGGFYQRKIGEHCLEQFKLNMSRLDQNLYYESLTNCTYHVALRLDCYWPNQVVDRFFTRVHRHYFHDCALTGRLLQDPPISILGPFIAVPLLVTLLVTSLVVWRSKRSEGIL
ncbi:hypothetical protein CRUP_024149 [Coryphaenoides rupestris]|nr:hypothetical protein CRUP_024149 [Coryphaenoides rupestris]